MMLKKISIIVGVLLFSQAAPADNIGLMDLFKRGKNFIKVGGALGGDTFARTTEGDELDAGDAFTLAYGRDLRYSDRSKRFFRVSAGLKFGFLDADNGTATVYAIPVNVMYMQQNARFIYGGGVTAHVAASLDNGINSDTEALSPGLTGQAAYRFSDSKEIGISVDIVEYDSVSANAIGIYFINRFGVK